MAVPAPTAYYRYWCSAFAEVAMSFGSPWDVRTYYVNADNKSLTTGTASAMAGGTMSNDGLHAFILSGGSSLDRVSSWTLSTAWDLSTATYVTYKQINTEDTGVTSIWFRPDGLRMYMTGTTFDRVNEYSLSTAFDVSTLSFTQYVYLGGDPRGVWFDATGVHMIITDYGGSVLTEQHWTLSTAWDISTATLQNTSAGWSGILARNSFMSQDGLKLWRVRATSPYMIYEYELSTAWDVSTSQFSGRASYLSTQSGTPWVVFPRQDDLKKYVCFGTNKAAHTWYTLYDSTVNSFRRDPQYTYGTMTIPQTTSSYDITSIKIHPDGTWIYYVSSNSSYRRVYQYPLTTAWDIGSWTSTGAGSYYLGGQDTTPRGLWWKPDGTGYYISGDTNNKIFQYSCSTAWDVTTSSYVGASGTVASGAPFGDIQLSADGTKLFLMNIANDTLYRYPLTTAWDITTLGSTDQNIVLTSYDTLPYSFEWKRDGTRLMLMSASNDTIRMFDASTAWDLTTLTQYTSGNNISWVTASPGSMCWDETGRHCYITNLLTPRVIYGFYCE